MIAGRIAADLAEAGLPEKKEWWERYLKGVIPFRGVPMAEIRRIVRHRCGAAARPDLFDLAFDLMRGQVAEEKLAGILVLQEFVEIESHGELDRIGRLFDDGAIFDWNTTDWLCVRVLGPTIERRGEEIGRHLAGWVERPTLWGRRAGVVAFVGPAEKHPWAFPTMGELIEEAAGCLVRDQERFAQTGVGWVMRSLSEAEPGRVARFVQTHRDEMSREAIRMAVSRLDESTRAGLGVTGPRRRR